MSELQSVTRRPVPVFVDAVTKPVEAIHHTIKRVRHQRAHGYFALPDGTSKPWFNEPARDLMRLLAVDPTVRSFTPRPVCFRLFIDGDDIDHIPDFRVDRGNEKAIVDIIRPGKKKVSDTTEGDRAEREDRRKDVPDAMRRICDRRGLRYYRIPLEEIYTQPRYDNACELLRFKSVEPTPEFAFQVTDLLSRTRGASTQGAVEDALGGRDLVVPSLYALALRRMVMFEMNKPLSRDSRLWLLAERAGR